MLRVGLTGGIACGKSHVLRRLQRGGCRTLDLDRVAHEVQAAGGPVHAAVVAAFGTGVLRPDGEIDRKALGAVVFRDAAARARLNAIVHPAVRREERSRVAALAAEDPAAVVVVDAALLVEAGMHLRFDRLVVVHCAPEQQLQRLMDRDGLSRDDALARIASQMPIAEKRRFATDTLDSSGSLDETHARADALADALGASARRRPSRRAADAAALAKLLGESAVSADDRRAAASLLDDIVDADGLELFRVAERAGRPAATQWLAAPGVASAFRPEALMPPVAAFCLARHGREEPWLAVAAMSVARAVTGEPARVEEACAAARRAASALWQGTAGSAVAPAELAAPLARFVAACQAWATAA